MVRIRLGSSGGGQPSGCAGRVGMTLFFGVFLAMGLLFCFFIVRETLQIAATRSWTATPCVIEHSGVDRVDDGYALAIRYRYEFGGVTRRGEHADEVVADSSYAKLARIADRHPPGSEATCYVNPANGDEAILAHRSMGFALMIFLPLIFVAVGAGGIYGAWSAGRGGAERERSKLGSSGRSTGRRVGWIVLAVVAIAGGAFTWYFTIGTIGEFVAAKSWPATPCVVESSRVRSHSSDDGTTYSVDILYRYSVGGREYASNRYSFVGGSSSGYARKKAIVERHRPGSQAVCYVDPRDPHNALLHRDFSWMLLLTLIPLIPLAIGVGGLVHMSRTRGASEARSRGERPGRPIDERRTTRDDADRPAYLPRPKHTPGERGVTLRPAATRLGKLIGLTIFALFWNGVVSVFVVHAITDGELVMGLFMIPFVLVGLGVIGGVLWTLLAMLNARVVLTVSAADVGVGGSIDLDWDLVGRIASIRRLRITLEGREEATYRRGTDTVTDKHVFTTIEVADTTGRSQIDRGSAKLSIPAGTMHSLDASNNKIIWTLKVHGEIRRWPDIDEEYPIVVLPRVEGGER